MTASRVAPRRSDDEPRDAGRPFSVLIVDDDADTRTSLRKILEGDSPPFLVMTAESGREALDMLPGAQVDVVLADYRMKPMNGLKLLVEVRKRAPRVKRMMITAYPDMNVSIAAVNEAGVEHLFLKPVDPNEFLHAMQRLRSEREAEAEGAGNFARRLDELRRGPGPP